MNVIFDIDEWWSEQLIFTQEILRLTCVSRITGRSMDAKDLESKGRAILLLL